jgi:hypothetical protein
MTDKREKINKQPKIVYVQNFFICALSGLKANAEK